MGSQMHYFQHDIKAFNYATRHLSLLEKGIYRELIDLYYDTESPIISEKNKIFKLIGANTAKEKKIVSDILDEFFFLENGRYYHSKCEEVLEKIRNKSQKARESAQRRWANQAKLSGGNVCERNANAMRTQCETHATNTTHNIIHNTKDIKESDKSDPDYQQAVFMFKKIKDVVPLAKEPNYQKWANTIRLIRERDNIPPEQINSIFLWANNHSFWKTNILSPAKLRKQIPKLDAEIRNEANRPGNKSISLVERVQQNCDRDLKEIRKD